MKAARTTLKRVSLRCVCVYVWCVGSPSSQARKFQHGTKERAQFLAKLRAKAAARAAKAEKERRSGKRYSSRGWSEAEWRKHLTRKRQERNQVDGAAGAVWGSLAVAVAAAMVTARRPASNSKIEAKKYTGRERPIPSSLCATCSRVVACGLVGWLVGWLVGHLILRSVG